MTTVDLEFLASDDSDPLTVDDWAALWIQLARNGCECVLSNSLSQPDGSKSPDMIIGLVLSALSARFMPVLVRFYEARRQVRITLRHGPDEWTFEKLSAAEFERAVETALRAISAIEDVADHDDGAAAPGLADSNR